MANRSSILAWKSHGQRSLGGYSPWGPRELDTTEWRNNNIGPSALGVSFDRGPLGRFFWVCGILHAKESRCVLNKCDSETAFFFFFKVFSKIKITPEMSSHRFTLCPKIMLNLTYLYVYFPVQGSWGWQRGKTYHSICCRGVRLIVIVAAMTFRVLNK